MTELNHSSPATPFPIPLSLYVHLPWCVRRCPYCDFNSHTAGASPPKARYINALLKDIELAAARVADRRLVSVFLGGGTPSLFTPAEIGAVLDQVRDQFTLVDDAEVTMEANPGTVECGDPAGYRAAGVNRLSIGAQSFDAKMLQLLGRIHDVSDISRSVSEAQAAGFDNINVDLMHDLPDQTVSLALSDIDAALALNVQHISWYQLTLEPNTVFHARPPANLPDELTSDAIATAGGERLAAAGYGQYEISAWARPGRESRHNLNYWRFGDYLAVGAGAHGKYTVNATILRSVRAANPQQYMQDVENNAGVAECVISGDDLLFEFMLNVSRLRESFSDGQFSERTGLDAGELQRSLEPVIENGLIRRVGVGEWQITDLGRRFLNDLQAQFLPTQS